MSQECTKEKSPGEEQRKKLSGDSNQAAVANEYEFFLSESDLSEDKEIGENQKSDLMDFFLSK
ncbi:MAG: hypothetical protein A4E70_01406 [Syntrophus sp. PtaU1.Bin005]|jgi:hypothetical protein|uniref:hypothetical protein n=1 Tax=Syntrophus sp. (in: bacteria) TaxID=48412 RepID=UPI0009C74375|nr:MAG: hypothetical protein A4E69_02671 [Syntrophus sp. PtaB.Bin138]OPY81139.1 MAG: hypothetical protein A4E70_01406 [Syntrophus sp. PtaU1.Bin005]